MGNLNSENPLEQEKLARPERLPVPGQQVLVQCEGFRCMAFRDSKGKWYDAFSKKELTGVLRILYME